VVVTAEADGRLRADAARNIERLLRAAREVYAELGPDVPMEIVARRAGVGERTLYRRFPTKGDLVRAALEQSISENLLPVIEKARRNADPLRGLAQLIEAAISLGAREHNMLAAARRADAIDDISAPLDEALNDLMVRAQRAGRVRADLVADDLPRIIAMLNSVLWTMDPASDGWRRYVALILDAISTTTPRRLPPAAALQHPQRLDGWPM
jgi:AcrR family transcriptional regulator